MQLLISWYSRERFAAAMASSLFLCLFAHSSGHWLINCRVVSFTPVAVPEAPTEEAADVLTEEAASGI